MRRSDVRSKAVAAVMTGYVGPRLAGSRGNADFGQLLRAVWLAARRSLRGSRARQRVAVPGAGPAAHPGRAEIDPVRCILAPFVSVPAEHRRLND
jgi:hypothetical protein